MFCLILLNLGTFLYFFSLLKVPMLQPGHSIKISCLGHEDPVIVHQPDVSEMPFLDIYLSYVIDLVGGPDNLLYLLTSLLMEHQMLLVSEGKLLLACCKSMICRSSC